MLKLTAVLGHASDDVLADRLHEIAHHGVLETITIAAADVARRRLQAHTDRGTAVGIALDRDVQLSNGAVLWLEPARAIVVRLDEPTWMTVLPSAIEDALELGYCVGNLHWKVRFDGSKLLIALEGPPERYLDRLGPFIAAGRIQVLS